MSKVQLKDINNQEKIYPITNAEYVEGFDSKFSELNKKDEEDINQLKEKIEELDQREDKDTIYDDSEIKQRLDDIEENYATKEELEKSIDDSLTEGIKRIWDKSKETFVEIPDTIISQSEGPLGGVNIDLGKVSKGDKYEISFDTNFTQTSKKNKYYDTNEPEIPNGEEIHVYIETPSSHRGEVISKYWYIYESHFETILEVNKDVDKATLWITPGEVYFENSESIYNLKVKVKGSYITKKEADETYASKEYSDAGDQAILDKLGIKENEEIFKLEEAESYYNGYNQIYYKLPFTNVKSGDTFSVCMGRDGDNLSSNEYNPIFFSSPEYFNNNLLGKGDAKRLPNTWLVTITKDSPEVYLLIGNSDVNDKVYHVVVTKGSTPVTWEETQDNGIPFLTKDEAKDIYQEKGNYLTEEKGNELYESKKPENLATSIIGVNSKDTLENFELDDDFSTKIVLKSPIKKGEQVAICIKEINITYGYLEYFLIDDSFQDFSDVFTINKGEYKNFTSILTSTDDIENPRIQMRLAAGACKKITVVKGSTPYTWEQLYGEEGFTKEEADNLYQPKGNYATKEDINKIDLSSKEDKFTVGKGLQMTEDRVLNCTLDTTVFKVVDSLPQRPAEGDESKIHIVLKSKDNGLTSENNGFMPAAVGEPVHVYNSYNEYIWVDYSWEKVGEFEASTDVDLSEYVKTSELDSEVEKLKKYVTRDILDGVSKIEEFNYHDDAVAFEHLTYDGSGNRWVASELLFIEAATPKEAGVMSAADKTKLDSLKNYTLPQATDTTLGGVKEWYGTQDEYDALGTYDENTKYYIIEEE